MDSDLLRAFVAVTETGGFGAAAKLLNRTQSAVSLQIKRLEDRLGATLFDRTSRSVKLTADGARLLPYARRLLDLEDEAQAQLTGTVEGERIRFGLTEEHAAAHLPALLSRLRAAHPETRVEIVCAISSDLVDLFQEGRLDLVLAVRHGPTRTGRVLGVERMIWVAQSGFELPEDTPLPLALNPEGCLFRAHALAAIGRMGRGWSEPYLSQSPTGINVAVQSGLALTVKTPRSVPPGCDDAGDRLGLPPLGLAEIEMHVSPARIGEDFRHLVRLVEAQCGDAGAARRAQSTSSG